MFMFIIMSIRTNTSYFTSHIIKNELSLQTSGVWHLSPRSLMYDYSQLF